MTKKDPSAAVREAAYAARQNKAGLVRVCVWVPVARRADIQEVAEQMRLAEPTGQR